MKNQFNFQIFIFFLIFLGCGNKNEPLKKHHPTDDLTQNITSEYAQILFDEAYDEYGNGDFRSAESKIKEALTIEKNPILFNQLGIIQLAGTRHVEALHNFRKATKIDSTYWPAYINEARADIDLKSYVEGLKILNHLKYKSNSHYWKAYADFYLAVLYFNDGNQCDLALNYLDKSSGLKNDEDLQIAYRSIQKQVQEFCSK